MSTTLLSPVTGAALVAEGPDLLRDVDDRLWPQIDGIPYLRTGRDALVAEAANRLRADDRDGALALLLADQDDWWTGVKPGPDPLGRLIRHRDTLSLRDAMDLLGFDRVGHYFAHRWSDPTFLAGLALLEAHWRPTATAFELACGIGHYGRDLLRRGVGFTGADVVFSKLWLARHWVLPPEAKLICFDAASPWPIADQRFDLVFCHDAFYFLEPKATILDALRGLAAPNGRLALSHIHNAETDNLSAGRAMTADAVEAMFPQATVYDDAELTHALVEARPPRAAPIGTLRGVEAFSLEDAPLQPAQALAGGLATPPPSAALRLNPLYRREDHGFAVTWPTPRYAAEYGGRATYPLRWPAEAEVPDPQDSAAIRRRVFVDLPERW